MARKNGCSNPECHNGVTPGVILIGGGRNSAPLISNGVMQKTPMRWGWVRCIACRPEEKDPPWKPKSLTPEDMEQRKRWADSKSSYTEPQQKRLEKIKLNTPDQPTSAAAPPANDRIDKLLDKISELTETVTRLSLQVADLSAENARLRTAPQEPKTTPEPPSGSGETPKRRKSRQIAKPS